MRIGGAFLWIWWILVGQSCRHHPQRKKTIRNGWSNKEHVRFGWNHSVGMKCMLFGMCPWFLPHLNSRLLTSECSQEFTPEMTFHVNKLACIFLKYGQNTWTCISVARNQVAEDIWMQRFYGLLGNFQTAQSGLIHWRPCHLASAMHSFLSNQAQNVELESPFQHHTISAAYFLIKWLRRILWKPLRCCRCFCTCLCSGQVLGSYSNCLPSLLYKGGRVSMTSLPFMLLMTPIWTLLWY